MSERTPRCEKTRYTTEQKCVAAIIKMTQETWLSGQEHPLIKPYLCPDCNGWHMTRQAAKGYWKAYERRFAG